MKEEENLDRLREETQKVTVEILRLVGERLSLAKRIGETKHKRGLPMEDQKIEEELRRVVLEKCKMCGVDSGFSLKLLKLLIEEAKRVQREAVEE